MIALAALLHLQPAISQQSSERPLAISLGGDDFGVGAILDGTVERSGSRLIFRFSRAVLRAKLDVEICAFGFSVSRKEGGSFAPIAIAPAQRAHHRIKRDAVLEVPDLKFVVPLPASMDPSSVWATFVMLTVLDGECKGSMYVHGSQGALSSVIR